MLSKSRKIAIAGTLGVALAAGQVGQSVAGPLPVISGDQIAGRRLTEQAYWYGWGPAWGGALAAGAIVGGALGLAAAAAAPIGPYGYGYPVYYSPYYPYPVYYRRYRRRYWAPRVWRSHYVYPTYYRGYRRAYWRPIHRWRYPRAHYRRVYRY